MKKLLHNRNFYLILFLIVVIAALLIAGKTIQLKPRDLPAVVETVATGTPVPAVTQPPAATEAPAVTDVPADTSAPTGAELFTGPGYVYIVANNEGRWFELPQEPGTITLRGEERVNVIRLTDHSVMMESSTCDNQDCVHQGEVTLENLSERALYNMILCLPHQVTIELFTPQEMQRMYDEQMNAQN